MADTKLTDLADQGSVGDGDTGDIMYIVTAAGVSTQQQLGSLVNYEAADTGNVVQTINMPADILTESSGEC